MYIHTLVLPDSQLSSIAVERAFSSRGRLKEVDGRDWGNGYVFKPFKVVGTGREFEYSRRQVGQGEIASSNISSSWTPGGSETVIGGTMQGRKQFDGRGASRVCKRRMWRLALEVAVRVGVPVLVRYLTASKYLDLKNGDLLAERRRVKGDVREVLGGWVRNEGGDEFSLDGAEL